MFWDKLAELQVLTFFCANDHIVELPARNAPGPKPEFFIQINETVLGVEVKNLDADALLDRIFGDFDTEIEDIRRDVGIETSFDGPEDYRGIVGMIERQYREAVQKFSTTTGLVFIYVPWSQRGLGRYLHEFCNTLYTSWRDGDGLDIAGLVLVFDDSVLFQQNPKHQTLTQNLRFGRVDLEGLRNIYENCTAHDLWPR